MYVYIYTYISIYIYPATMANLSLVIFSFPFLSRPLFLSSSHSQMIIPIPIPIPYHTRTRTQPINISSTPQFFIHPDSRAISPRPFPDLSPSPTLPIRVLHAQTNQIHQSVHRWSRIPFCESPFYCSSCDRLILDLGKLPYSVRFLQFLQY